MSKYLESKSKFLSLVLRHKPEEIGLSLDQQGWVEIDELIRRARARGTDLTRELLSEIVSTNNKQRFAIDPSGKRIRANQGHSIAIDSGLAPLEPPARLFHGTATRFVQSIRENGLVSGSRQHVHLSLDRIVATEVGARHGKPLVLIVSASDMHRDGHKFYLSANGVWLTTAVPVDYLEFPVEVYTADASGS